MTALYNQPEAFTLDLGDEQLRYLLRKDQSQVWHWSYSHQHTSSLFGFLL